MLIVSSSTLGIGYFFALLPSFTRSSYWLPTLQGVRQKTNSSKVSLAHIYHSRQTNLIETYQRWPLLGHQGEEAWFLIHPTRFPKLALCSQLVLQAARKDWRTRSSSHMHPSDIIAKLQRQFGNIPTTACLQAADCESPRVSASHPCDVACLVVFGCCCFYFLWVFFGFLVIFWICRRSQNRTKQPKAAKLGQVLFYFKGHFTETKQPWLKNLVRCDFGSLIALFFSRKRLFVHFLIWLQDIVKGRFMGRNMGYPLELI